MGSGDQLSRHVPVPVLFHFHGVYFRTVLYHTCSPILADNSPVLSLAISRAVTVANGPPGWYLISLEFYQQCYVCIYHCPIAVIEFCQITTNHPNALQTPSHPSYIEDGYSITRTDAPKDFGGRLRLNCARTTPEFPWCLLAIDSSIFGDRHNITYRVVS